MRTWKVGDIASWLGISANGVYYLEKHGAVNPAHNEGNGYRSFTNDDFAVLSVVRRYQALGFTLDESLELLGGSPDEVADAVAAALERERARHGEAMRRLSELAREADSVPREMAIGLAARPHLLALPVLDEPDNETPEERVARELQDELDNRWYRIDGASFGFILSRFDEAPPGFGYQRCTIAPAQDIFSANLAGRGTVVDFPADPWCAHVVTPLEANADDAFFMRPALEALALHGLGCRGDVVGRIAHLRRTGDGLEVSREFWIPVCGLEVASGA